MDPPPNELMTKDGETPEADISSSNDVTTKGDNDDVTLKTLKQSCRAYAGSLTRKYNELEVLMLDPANHNVVTTKYSQLNDIFRSYAERFNEYHNK